MGEQSSGNIQLSLFRTHPDPGVSNTNESGIAQATLAGVAFVSRRSLHHWLIMVPATTKLCFYWRHSGGKNYRVDACPRQQIAGTPQNSTGSVITATVVDIMAFR